MKIIATTVDHHRQELRVQVRHGVWPFCIYREYYGIKNKWKHDVVSGATFTCPASPKVRAYLTRHYMTVIAYEPADRDPEPHAGGSIR